MIRLLAVAGLAVVVAGCTGMGVRKVSGDENQVVLSAPDQERAKQHCASFGKDPVNLGRDRGGNTTYACRPRAQG